MTDTRRKMTRILLACLLLWAQVALSVHELDATDSGHLHAADCTLCVFGHAADSGLVSAGLAFEPASIAEAPVSATLVPPAIRFYSPHAIRAPPCA